MKIKLFNRLNKPARISVIVISAVLVVLLTLTWIMFAIIQVHKHVTYGFENASSQVRTVAHRGWSEKYFDNTKQSFVAAGENPFFDAIETDIRQTADGIWVCTHDDNPFVDKNIKVTESRYADIKDLPLDITDGHDSIDKTISYRIPTFDDYLEVCASHKKIALIEIKGNYDAETLAEPVNRALNFIGYNNAYFGSFSLKSIESVLENDRYARVLLFSGQALTAYCYNKMGFSVGVNKKILTDKLISRANDNETATFVYTIQSAEEYNKYKAMGVNFIITDYSFAE